MNIGGTINHVMEKVSSPVSGSPFKGGENICSCTDPAGSVHACVCVAGVGGAEGH